MRPGKRFVDLMVHGPQNRQVSQELCFETTRELLYIMPRAFWCLIFRL